MSAILLLIAEVALALLLLRRLLARGPLPARALRADPDEDEARRRSDAFG